MSNRIGTLALTLATLGAMAVGQKSPDTRKQEAKPSPTPERSFGRMLAERDTLSKEISDLDTDVYWIGDAMGKIEDEKNPGKHTKEADQAIAQSMGNAHLSPKTRREDLDNELSAKKKLMGDKQEQKNRIDGELEHLADVVAPEQQFKGHMSSVFAWLVGLVIVGFFVIAVLDQKVRGEIFAGQAGIQFVTLFSLVIAIILFGIIGILEGKELAALLGGLSGYILGRSTSAEKPHTPPPATPHLVTPPANV